MHLPELDSDAVTGFIANHPGSMVILRSESIPVLQPDLRRALATAPLNTRLDGDLAVACF